MKQTPGTDKSVQERQDLLTLLAPLDSGLRDHLVALWEEYENASSAEARLVKGLDKLETIMQHNQGLNSENFDYAFNLTYGQKHTSSNPLFRVIRALLDEETAGKAALPKCLSQATGLSVRFFPNSAVPQQDF